MTTSSESDLDRVRRAYQPLLTPVPQATAARLDALIAEAADAARSDMAAGVAANQRPRRTRLLIGAGATCLLALLVVAAAALLPGGSHAPVPETASARAACAPRGPAATCVNALYPLILGRALPGHGDLTYVRSRWVAMSYTIDDRPDGRDNHISLATAKLPFQVDRLATEEYWIAPDGSGRIAQTDPGAARLPSTADEAAWRAAGSPKLETLIPPAGKGMRPLAQNVTDINDALLGANGLYDFLPHHGDPLAPIPHDPRALATWLRTRAWKERIGRDAGCRPDGDGCEPVTRRLIASTVIGDITTLLSYPATPAPLAAALVRVLGTQPGARALGIMHDQAGRDVTAISFPPGSTDTPDQGVVALDPETGVLRAIGARHANTIRWLRTYAVTAVRVAHINTRP